MGGGRACLGRVFGALARGAKLAHVFTFDALHPGQRALFLIEFDRPHASSLPSRHNHGAKCTAGQQWSKSLVARRFSDLTLTPLFSAPPDHLIFSARSSAAPRPAHATPSFAPSGASHRHAAGAPLQGYHAADRVAR